MKLELDPQADAMYFNLRSGAVARSKCVHDDVVLDLDAAGRILGIEILNIHRHVDRPGELHFERLEPAPR